MSEGNNISASSSAGREKAKELERLAKKEKKKQKKARAKKRRRRIRFYFVVGLFAALVILFFCFRAGLLNERIVRFGVAQAGKYFKGGMKIESLDGRPLSDFIVTGLEIYEPTGEVAISVDRARVKWDPLGGGLLKPVIHLEVEGAFVKAVKRDGEWNLTNLKRKKKTKRTRAMRFPTLSGDLVVRDSRLYLSPSPDRVIKAEIFSAAADVKTLREAVYYRIKDLMGNVEDPALGINQLTAEGMIIPTIEGWAFPVKKGELITATSIARVKKSRYYTGTGEMEVVSDYLAVAPDVLSLFWPGHPIAIPLKGTARAKGVTSKSIDFEAVLESSAGKADAKGTYLRGDGSVTASGKMEDFTLSGLLNREVPLSNLTGSYDISYAKARKDEKGHEKSPRRVEVTVRLDKFSYPGLKSFPVMASLELKDRDYSLRMIGEDHGSDATVYADGKLDEPYPIDVTAIMRDLNPSAVRDGAPDVKLSGKLAFVGSGRSPETIALTGKVDLDPTRFMGYEVRYAASSFSFANKRLSLRGTRAMVDGVNLEASGWIEPLGGEVPYRFDVQAEMPERETVARFTKGAISAAMIELDMDLTGQRDRWRAVGSGAAMDVSVDPLEAGAVDFTYNLAGVSSKSLSGTIELLADSTRAPTIQYGDFSIPVFNLELAAKLAPAPPTSPSIAYSLNARSSNPDFGLKSEGALRVRGAGSWDLDLDALSARLIGQDWSLAEKTRVSSRGGGLNFDETLLKSGEASIGANGDVYGRRLGGEITFERFDAGPWLEKLAPEVKLAGRVTGKIVGEGQDSDPSVTVEMDVADFSYSGFNLKRLKGGLDFRDEKLAIDLKGASEEVGLVKVAGDIPFVLALNPIKAEPIKDRDVALDVTASDVSGAAIAELLPWITDVEGEVVLDARIRGTFEKPDWSGLAEIKDARFKVPDWGLALRDVSGKAVIEDNVAHVSGLRVESGQGAAELSGDIKIEGYSASEVNLTLTSRAFRAMNTPDMRAEVDADLKITGDPAAPTLRGAITFTELSYRPPLLLTYQGTSWEEEDPTIRIEGEEEAPDRQSPWLERADLEIDIDIPDTGKLRSSELNVGFGGKLSLRKPPGGFFLVFGDARTKDGWLVFQGKPFRIEKGSFSFPAIPVIDPDMEIIASYRVPDYVTYIKVFGTLSDPRLEIYSEPPLDEADVFAVILFGKPVSDLAEGERQALAAAGGQVIAGWATSGLSEALQVDTLIIQTGETPEESGVGIGKYINDKIYVFYYRQFGEEAAQEYKIRYELRKNLSIEGSHDEEGQGGVDVYYSRPY